MTQAADDPGVLPVAETFVSVQGEGRLTGTPSWFVRTSGCNLRCAWCDTPYASWRPGGARRSVDDLTREVARAVWQGAPVRHAVITGGEPMLFPAVAVLSHALKRARLHVTIETAGTVLLPGVHADLMSISPKLASSTPTPAQARAGGLDEGWPARHEARRIDLAVLQRLLDDFGPGRRQLKFVVTGAHDLREIDTLLASLRAVARDDVLLMPEGVTVPTPERRAWLEGVCAARGWTYCRRLHIELFGNVRGT